MAARVVFAKQHPGQRRPLILRRMRHVQDRRHMLLAPVNSKGKTRNQHHHSLWVHGVHLPHQLLLRQIDDLPIASFAPVAGHGAGKRPASVRRVHPVMRHVWPAGRIVPHHHHRNIGMARGRDRGLAQLIGRVVHLHVRTNFILDPLERRDLIRRCPAIPVPVDRIRQGPNHRDRLDLRLVQRQQILVVFQQNHRLQRELL